ncbi:MAG: FkbM family methyltransferase [Rhodocyclaceae bacterium]|nr:FkbM family methyltransferase [Rhodocyclaceae bacterium]
MSTTKKRAFFERASDLLIALIGLNRPIRLYRAFLARINCIKRVRVNGTDISFDANDELHLLRAIWLDKKEPETLEWIDGFGQGDVFYDVGANVGVFSLYASLHRGCDVFAFEPEAKNYSCLNKNIFLNRLGRRVKALNVGLHDATSIEFLQLHDLASGAALHSVGEAIDWRGERFEAKFEQAVLAFRLDEMIELFRMPQPIHMKIDVDGNELKVIRGAARTLSDSRFRSLQIELKEGDRDLIQAIESCGLILFRSTRAALQGEHRDCLNAVFTRA